MTKALHFLDYFSSSYTELREKFLYTAGQAGANVDSFANPAPGPDAETLYTDVARLGTKNARKVLVLVSGTHGVEGYSGSGCQNGWLVEQGGQSLPEDTAVVLVHLLNPYGVAWQRRQNENNVDVNRNFIKHDNQMRPNPDYDQVHDLLVLPSLDHITVANAERALADFILARGEEAYGRALTAQYQHPDGLFYGGEEESWSNRILHQVLSEHCSNAEHVAFIDFHSGMGPFGYGMLLSPYNLHQADSARAKNWFGDSMISLIQTDARLDEETVAQMYTSCTMDAVIRALPDKTVTALTLEFGTYPFDQCVPLMREDAWLYKNGDPLNEQGMDIRRRWLEVFYPATPDWLEMVWWRSQQIIRQAIVGLAASG